MAETSDFNAMNSEELINICRNVKRIRLKTSLVKLIASAVEIVVLPVDPNFAKDQTSDADKLIIHDMVSHNPFSLHEDRGNFNSSPPFGLYDIFNYLISPTTSTRTRRLQVI